jgi:hypothetical protein
MLDKNGEEMPALGNESFQSELREIEEQRETHRKSLVNLNQAFTRINIDEKELL